MEESRKEKILHIATLVEREDGKERVVIEVKDSGKGIPLEIRDKIFEPFFSTKDMGKGTGLGLSICYGIVEEHGGHIKVESVPGEFSRFRVRLPAAEKEASGEVPDERGPGGDRTSPVVA
jgi:signal transduction histidine kinase